METNDVGIHPSASVHPKAELGSGVFIGPGAVVGEHVRIGRRTRIEAHVNLDGWTEIGEECRFSPFSSIGTEPQDLSYRGEETRVVIGDRNVFREYITINRGTVKGGGITRIGSDNYFMAYAHVGHDCTVGNEVILTNAATLGGHVSVGDFCYLSAMTGVHQFCRIGRYSFIGGFSVITQDVLPFSKWAGLRPLQFYGLNAIGLRRRGFSRERIKILKAMFKIIFYSDLNTTQALDRIREEVPPGEDRDEIISFMSSSRRGFHKKAGQEWSDDSE